MSEDERGDVHLLVLVLLHGDPLAVVVHADLALLAVDVDADGVHLFVADLRGEFNVVKLSVYHEF